MARPDPAIELIDAERRDLIALIRAGKALPEKHRFVLFEDKREVELAQPRRYQVAVKVIDIFGSDTTTIVPVNVG